MMREVKKRAAHFSLRARTFFYLAVFILVILAVLWIFQIFLLRPMYEALKTREMRAVSERLAHEADSDGWDATSDMLSQKTNICISIYEIRGQSAYSIVNSHIRSSCILHNIASDSLMNRLYAGAQRDGYYTEEIPGNFLTGAGEESGADVPKSIITSRLVKTEAGDTYLILLNAEIEPAGTMASTLQLQFGVTTVLLLIFAVVMAFFISGTIARPIAQMSNEAKKMAQGIYDVHFDGGNTKETAELGDSLNYAAQELSVLDTMQKDLLANISHDLRTPLTMISGYSEVMRDIPGEMTSENMQIIIDEAHRLTTLVNDILDLSKLSAGSQVLQCETLSLTELVETTLNRYAKLRTQVNYKLSFTFQREAYIYADRSKILQVVYNLISNAINYTGEDNSVTIQQVCDNGQCRIEVTDTGEGIPAEQLPLIWDRYYKGQSYHKRAVTGTGLGLSIVKNILLLHGAQFGVTSTVGVGSTFWFSLPEINPPVNALTDVSTD